MSQDSLTYWIGQLRQGNEQAAQRLWEQYFDRLLGLLRKRRPNAARRAADEEDVAVSALKSLFLGVREGRFPRVNDPDDLWRLLVVIAARKAGNQAKHFRRQKRGGGKLRGESVFLDLDGDDKGRGIEQIIGNEPTPAFAAEVAEEAERLLAALDDASLRQVALWKLDSLTEEEIAERLGCTTRTVRRKLALIREIWSRGR